MIESPLVDSGYVVPVFSSGDDPITCLNIAMAFLTVVASSKFPSTNNQFRTSSNPRNQSTIQDDRVIATIQDGRVIVQQVQRRQGQSYYGTGYKSNATSSRGNNSSGQTRVVKCYNCQGEGHMARQCTQPKLRILTLMILTVMISRMQKRFSWPTFPTMVLTLSQSESKEKEDKYMENEINLEKKIKELDNILFKVGQSAQTVHMLTKPQALGYQNPFHLKKAQRIKPTLYDGIVMSAKYVVMPVIDDEETLILEKESRSKMFEKAKDPEVINKNISHKPIDYEKLNRLSEDFGKHFTPQQEMDVEQAFLFCISDAVVVRLLHEVLQLSRQSA
ncbi:retrovirus-related pol polyprotein from transposon TNT 1-94 [Tanacetum coccineum]